MEKEVVSTENEHGYSSKRTNPLDLDHGYTCHEESVKIKTKQYKKKIGDARVIELITNSIKSTKVVPVIDSILLSEEDYNDIWSILSTRKIQEISSKIINIPCMAEEIISEVLGNSYIKNRLVEEISTEEGREPECMVGISHNPSYLMVKDYDALLETKNYPIIAELEKHFPALFRLLVNIMLPQTALSTPDTSKIPDIQSRLAIVYAIIMFTRNPNLSRIQRLNAVCFLDHQVDKKIFDRCNPLGYTVSYSVVNNLKKLISKRNDDLILTHIREGMYCKIVADNLNFQIGVAYEKEDKHKHMMHMFTAIVCLYPNHFRHKSPEPEMKLEDLNIETVIIKPEGYNHLKQGFIMLAAHALAEMCPSLQFMLDLVPKNLATAESRLYSGKTPVYGTSVLDLNEMCYQDDVKILDAYETKARLYTEASEFLKEIGICGDWLTCDRLSLAKLLRIGNRDPADRFEHIGSVTWGWWHAFCNYLQTMVFDRLYKKGDGPYDLGTLRSEAIRRCRTEVDGKVKDNYSSHKYMFKSYFKATLAMFAMHYFGMDDIHSPITKNGPTQGCNKKELKVWLYSALGDLIDVFAFPTLTRKGTDTVLQETKDLKQWREISLSGGVKAWVPIKTKVEVIRTKEADKKMDYFTYVMETGFTYSYMLKLGKTPNRASVLQLARLLFTQQRGIRPHAHYTRAYFRTLVQHLCHFSQQDSYMELHANYVNTNGKPDGTIPSDERCEWHIGDCKCHLKNLYSNKTPEIISVNTAAIAGIREISRNFDQENEVIVRCNRHKRPNYLQDELCMLEDLRGLDLFREGIHTEGRYFAGLDKIPRNTTSNIDLTKTASWVLYHKGRIVK